MPTWYLAGTERFRGPVPTSAVTIFTPDVIFGANLMAWWDAADGLGGSTATDRTANAHNLTASGSPAITVGSVINGHPAYVYTHGTGKLTAGTPDSASFPTIGTAGGIFMVANATSVSDTFARFVSINLTGGNDFDNVSAITGNLSQSSNSIVSTCNSLNQGTLTNWVSGTNYIICWSWDAATTYVYINNVLSGSISVGGSINVGGPSALTLGNLSVAASGSIEGAIGACFIVNVTPDSTQRTNSYNYLHDRFGV